MSTAFKLKKGFSIQVLSWHASTLCSGDQTPCETRCCLQGNPDAHRRNYTGLLQDVAANPELMRDPRFELDLFAWKQLDPTIVPKAVNSKIVYKHLKFPVGQRQPGFFGSVYVAMTDLGPR